MTEASLITDGARVSYGVGRQMGDQLRQNPIPDMQLDAVLKGLSDAFQGVASPVSDEVMRASFEAINEILQAKANAAAEQAAAAGRERAGRLGLWLFAAEKQSALAENAFHRGVSGTASHL